MSNATLIRNKQEDLLHQLEKAGASTTTSSDSLDTLKANSLLASDILEAMGQWNGAAYCFNNGDMPRPKPSTVTVRGTRGGK